jgi:hypothetical protein
MDGQSSCGAMKGGRRRRGSKRHTRKGRRHHRRSMKKQAGGFLEGLGQTLYTAAVPFGLYGAQKSMHNRVTRRHRRSRRH